MKIYLHWTYSTKELTADKVSKHEQMKTRMETDTILIGGLERRPIFTHCINKNGYLHVLDYCPGHDMHVAIIGGLNSDYRYANTATYDQLMTLGNLVRAWMSMAYPVLEGDLENFNLRQWIKSISK